MHFWVLLVGKLCASRELKSIQMLFEMQKNGNASNKRQREREREKEEEEEEGERERECESASMFKF